MGAMVGRLDLLSDEAATGASKIWPGGTGKFAAEGTFDGATVSLQHKLPNGTWADAGPYTTLTAAGAGLFELPAGEIRAAVTGGSSPDALYASVYGIGA
jgi:hypothetical protein